MKRVYLTTIPDDLKNLNQWILWQTIVRDGKPTKIPFQVNGTPAKSNDATTWNAFTNVTNCYGDGKHSGIGFVFNADDPFYGVDLDGCRDPETLKVSDWAREIILKFGTYAEVSPSQTGVKLFGRGEPPVSGRKVMVKGEPDVGGKAAAIECYSELRYFAVTGWNLTGLTAIAENPEAATWLREKYFVGEPTPSAGPKTDFRSHDAIVERARKYLAKLPGAVSGQNGHNATFHAACVLVLGFALDESDALWIMHEFNERCQPRWSDRDLERKVKEANKQTGDRGYLRNAAPTSWGRIPVPTYTTAAPPIEADEPKIITLADSARLYIDAVRKGLNAAIGTSVPDLDYALGGGLEKGEMVIFAARPSHGKSAVALQCVHHWTKAGMKCAIVSEEMSALMLGKRTLQYTSNLPQEHWADGTHFLEQDIAKYESEHEPCIIFEGCRTAEKAASAITNAVYEHGVECAVVDYAQLLSSPGKGRYEQITNTSIALRQLASNSKILLLVLCQLNRGIESREDFRPTLADLKDSGQLEQDADVVTFLVWPHRVDKTEPLNKYKFFVSKNRNRAINETEVVAYWNPERQSVEDAPGRTYAEVPT